MTYRTPITDADLHAYVDGQLSPARRREVDEYLAAHPEAALAADDYRRLNERLRELHVEMLDEPLPAQLAMTLPPRRRLWRVAAAAALLSLGAVLGWGLHPVTETVAWPGRAMERELVQPAAFAHVVYAPEVRHPVEVAAADEAHLVAWLSKRLHTQIRAPDLSAHGYFLVGGRLLPSTDRMAAQFMYQGEDGRRVTLYTRRGAWDRQSASFRFARKDGVGVFYWLSGEQGYALVGGLERDELLTLSRSVHGQLRGSYEPAS